MDITEIEKLWQRDNDRLDKSLKFNEKLLLKIKDSAVGDFEKLVKLSVLGKNMAFIYFLISFVLSAFVITDIKYSIPGFMGGICMLLSFIYHLGPLEKIRKLNYHSMPVLELQKIISEFRIRSIAAGKYDFLIVAVWLVTLFPLYRLLVLHTDIYANSQQTLTFVLVSVGCVLVLFPLNKLMYKKLYDAKLKASELQLDEIINFEKMDVGN